MKVNDSHPMEGSGRSPDSNAIYAQFIAYDAEIAEEIDAIDAKYPAGSAPPNVVKDRQDLVDLQNQLRNSWQSYYNDPQATLKSFQQAMTGASGIMTQATAAYQDALGGGPSIHAQIQQEYTDAQGIVNQIAQAIAADENALSQVSSDEENLQQQIAQLQQQINQLPAGPQQAQAEEDLQKAKSALQTLQKDQASLTSQLAGLKQQLEMLTQPGGILDQLKNLASLNNPTQNNLSSASNLYKQIVGVQNTQYTLEGELNTVQTEEGAVEAALAVVKKDLQNPPNIKEQIQEKYQAALAAVTALQKLLSQDTSSLTTLTAQATALEAEIEQLQAQVDKLPSGTQKTQAIADLVKAQAALKNLQVDIGKLTAQISNLQGDLRAITKPGGILDQLKQLSSNQNPTAKDLSFATALYGSIQSAQNAQMGIQTSFNNTTADSIATTAAIDTVKADLNPPTPAKYRIEHGAWYINWTTWNTPPYTFPEGINTINIFVGEITIVDGKPTIAGTGFTPENLKLFIQEAHDHNPPIDVKISLGGAPGSKGYDVCWQQLLEKNPSPPPANIPNPALIQEYAQGMAAFCQANGLDGVDFDFEDWSFKNKGDPGSQASEETAVGMLIKDLKMINPNLQTSLCTNAGFSTWNADMKNILDAAKLPDGTSGVDRLYIMSYYDSLPTEEGFIQQWASWLEKNYGFSPAQVTVGIDDFDAHAYDPAAFAAWAASQGFSTCHWADNPS